MAEYLYRHFSKDTEMANRHLKRHSLLPIIREMEIKTTIRLHFRAVRIATSKKYTNNKCWRGCGVKEAPSTVCQDISWCSYYGKQYGGSSKATKKKKKKSCHII